MDKEDAYKMKKDLSAYDSEDEEYEDDLLN